MSTQRTPPADGADSPQDTGQHASRLPPPTERGATEIPGRVVARIAAKATEEALSRQAGPPSQRQGSASPGASAAVHDGSAGLAVSLDLPYPSDIAHTALRIQNDIAERVAQLTGLNISGVTLTVRRLVLADTAERARVR